MGYVWRRVLVLGLGLGLDWRVENGGLKDWGLRAIQGTPLEDKQVESFKSLETFAQTLFYIETLYVDPEKASTQTLLQHALQGLVSQLDPHSVFLPKKEFEQLTMDTKGKFGGVGVVVSQENQKLFVVSPIEGTPAARAGIKAGDEIIAIDKKALSALGPGEAVELMRGEPGESITLTMMRKDTPTPIDFVLVREMVKVKSVKTYALGDRISYVRISSFQEDTAEDFFQFLTKEASQLRGLVMDLRDNPGGLLNQSVRVVDMLIENGLIVSTVGRDPDKIEREYAYSKNTFKGFPIIVLVNEGSASASEIVAGALQDHKRALIMGTQTFGKGSVQTLLSLPDGSGLKLTVARYYTPNDRSIQAKGISPDIIVQPMDPVFKSDHKKESDLKGHIKNLPESVFSHLGEVQPTFQSTFQWPDVLKNDHQLLTAYTYLKGWGIFMQ